MTEEEKTFFMQEAIMEGKKALPNCLPNPPVGCVIVMDGKIVSRGHTQEPGNDHAEASALKCLPKDVNKLTLFVTLEPCSFFGRTPSCAKTMLNYPIEKVFVGMVDPHLKNQGAGIEILKNAGIEVETGILESMVIESLKTYLINDV